MYHTVGSYFTSIGDMIFIWQMPITSGMFDATHILYLRHEEHINDNSLNAEATAILRGEEKIEVQ